MKRLCFALLVCPIACAAPEGMMADTEDTETSSGSSGTEGMTTTMGTSVTAGTTMTSTTATTSATATTATTDMTMTTMDPDTGDSSMTATEATTTGDCPPGELDCPCDVGSTCTGELVCVDGTCLDELPCDEPEGEPNDDEASAVELAESACNAAEQMTSGGLAGGESDWFTFHAADMGFCLGNDPHVEVTADVDLAVCIFGTCDMGDTNIDCGMGSEASDSPDGVAGCCDQNQVTLGLGCGFMGTGAGTADIWVRVTSVEQACVPYELVWVY